MKAGTGLPSGLVLDPATGAISGTAAVAGPAAVKVTVTDSLGLSTSVGVNLAVAQKLAWSELRTGGPHSGGGRSSREAESGIQPTHAADQQSAAEVGAEHGPHLGAEQGP